MKKIALIEDRYKRQQDFLEQTNINLEEYAEFLENFIEEKADTLLEQIRKDDFDLSDFEIIICHKSVQNNTKVLSNLRNYCKKNDKILVLFSGGISVNYYNNSEFELLELNSQVIYTQNLILFLEAIKNDNEDIMMLCYGEHWKQNIVANVLEKTNRLINKTIKPVVYIKFANFVDLVKLKKIDYEFYQIKIENNYITIEEIKKLQESLQNYFHQFRTSSKKNKNLLIHHKDIANMEFEYSIQFMTDDDIDTYITSDIIKELSKKEFDTIFIKDNLSSNYLELYGLRVAYHIRLSTELGDKRFTPIVIISDFDEAVLNRFSKEANILFTEGVYICKNTTEDIEKFKSLELKGVPNYEEFLSSIDVSPPKDTSGSHGIANRWSIYRWAEFLNCKSEAIIKNKNEIENQLYFKYLQAIFPIIESYKDDNALDISTSKQQQMEGSGLKIVKKAQKPIQKVLYIDDEYDKGWEDIFKIYFSKKHKQEFEIRTIKEIQKDTTFDELKNYFTQYIQDEVPDIILLDLRIIADDHSEKNEQNISGVKLLKYIKEQINPGIQVILITASGKSTILNEANKYNILGYIKKEHPQDLSSNTKEIFEIFKKLLDEGLEKHYLKNIWKIQQDILKLDMFSCDKYYEIEVEVKSIFEILNTNMENRFIYCMFAIFKVLEILVKLYIEEKPENETRYAYWVNTNCKIPIVNNDNILVDTKSRDKNTSTENKIRVILHEKMELKDREIHNSVSTITKIRNNTIHPKKKKNNAEIRETIVLEWFTMLQTVLNKI